jgi:hypothetical protein
VIGKTSAVNIIARNQSSLFSSEILDFSVSVERRMSPLGSLLAAIISLTASFGSLVSLRLVSMFWVGFCSCPTRLEIGIDAAI